MRGIGGQGAQRVGVADDRDAVAGGQRLVGHELGDVEELVDVLDPDDAGLPEHRVEHLGPGLGLAHPVARRHAEGARPRTSRR